MGRKLDPVTCLDLVHTPLEDREFLLVSKYDRLAMGVQNPVVLMLKWPVFQAAYFKAKKKRHSFVLFDIPHSTLLFITRHFYGECPQMDHSEAGKIIAYYDEHRISRLRHLALEHLTRYPMDIPQAVSLWRLGFKAGSVRAKNLASRRMQELRDTSDENDTALGEALSHLEADESRSIVNELWICLPSEGA